jgi:hypothetical protein
MTTATIEQTSVKAQREPRKLDHSQPQKTTYAIPVWLRDQQIKHALRRVKGRIQPHPERADRVAIVGFGPSLADTWAEIKEFEYVISCSGAHKFLIERGIVPNWHVEVDPRSHKIALLGEPNPAVTYLPSSTSHPEYLEHLYKGLGQEIFDKQVLLWHVFDSSEEGARILPRGEWCITGGCDVGLRSIGIAAFFGFRDLHIFGLDGNARETRHAAEHPHTPKNYDICEYGGREWKTTAGMLEAARQIWHEFNQMPAVKFQFYGDGLIQAMAKDYKPNHKTPKGLSNVVGISRPELISTEHAELNRKLHEDNLAYGVGGAKYATVVSALVAKLTAKKEDGSVIVPSVLDYGCGKGLLAKSLSFPIWEYDPAIPEKSEAPRPADIVICTDVLEHIPKSHIPYVLDDLRRCVKVTGYFVIHTGPASKTYANGENAHLTQEGIGWWTYKLNKYFSIAQVNRQGMELHYVVSPKFKKPSK